MQDRALRRTFAKIKFSICFSVSLLNLCVVLFSLTNSSKRKGAKRVSQHNAVLNGLKVEEKEDLTQRGVTE
jgi:hypothetical protein